MSEKTDRGRVVKALRSLDGIPVENGAHPGTPDVECTAGWIELKWLADWPKRETTIVRLPKFFKYQRLWLRRRIERGGNAYLLLHTQRTQEWLLFDGAVAAKLVGHVVRQELRLAALVAWRGRQMDKEIAECLSSRKN